MATRSIEWYQEALVAGKTVKASYYLASGASYLGIAKRIFSAQDEKGEQWFVSIEDADGTIAAFPISEVDAEIEAA